MRNKHYPNTAVITVSSSRIKDRTLFYRYSDMRYYIDAGTFPSVHKVCFKTAASFQNIQEHTINSALDTLWEI